MSTPNTCRPSFASQLAWALVAVGGLSIPPSLAAAQAGAQAGPPKTPAPLERLGPSLLRVGNVRIDTATKQVSVAGVVLEASVLEFLAVTKGGFKAYESALELDTNAINFNLALILIGLDPAKSVGPKRQMDPALPSGDPVEIWVEWDASGTHRKVRAEELIYNKTAKATLPEGPWVYTGSKFVEGANAYLADIEGSLIGFAHTPATIIDSPRPLSPGGYGSDVLNPNLKLMPGTAVVLTVKALPRAK